MVSLLHGCKTKYVYYKSVCCTSISSITEMKVDQQESSRKIQLISQCATILARFTACQIAAWFILPPDCLISTESSGSIRIDFMPHLHQFLHDFMIDTRFQADCAAIFNFSTPGLGTAVMLNAGLLTRLLG